MILEIKKYGDDVVIKVNNEARYAGKNKNICRSVIFDIAEEFFPFRTKEELIEIEKDMAKSISGLKISESIPSDFKNDKVNN